MNRIIRKVAVLGSGIMGSRIACHFANIGVEVLLLDIVPREPNELEIKKGLSINDKAVRNRIINEALQTAIKSSPSPLYLKEFSSRIKTGNFEDDLKFLGDYDWIIEVVVENLAIKTKLFESVENFRKPGTLISSNTSGIPIGLMAKGRSEDFVKHFTGTHFFNPPRYLRLLEIIPTKNTDPAVIDYLMEYGEKFLGKTTVHCKDTPAFIANRIGVFSIMSLFHLVDKLGLTVEEVDKLTGPVLGRPKSATFRTCDVVGLDTLVHVANGLKENCPENEARETFSLPGYIREMVSRKWLGSKTEQGFYKKVKGEGGKSEIHALDLKTLEYKPPIKSKFKALELTKSIDSLKDRYKILISSDDRAGEFYRHSFFGLFSYVSHRIPEISDEIYKIDDALKAGFGWEGGPFEIWDILGIENTVKGMEALGYKPANWVYDFLKSGHKNFYISEKGKRKYFDIITNAYKLLPGVDSFLILNSIPEDQIVWKNAGTTVKHIGDGILNLEFHTKMNSIGSEVIEGINKAIDIAEKDYNGLVISNEGQNFSAGANLGMIFMMAIEQDFDEIDFAVRAFQKAMMRARYSSIPVVVAPHNMALGGACELSLHADAVQAHAETYMGLVEFGVGLIPGGGGSKEFALRASDAYFEGDIELPTLKEKFLTIGMAKVSTSAHEAFSLGYLLKGKDKISINRARQLTEAKETALALFNKGYTKPIERSDIKVLGKQGLGMFYAGAYTMFSGGYISEHDKKISEKLGYVLCGGDLSAPALVTEQYLLDLEREAFLSLCGEKKTLERMQSILTGGKILRN